MLLALLLLLLMCRAAEEWLNMFCSCGVCPTCDKCAAVTYIENPLLKLPSFMGMPRFAACFGAWWWKLGLKSSGYPLFFCSNHSAAIHLSPYPLSSLSDSTPDEDGETQKQFCWLDQY